jgi:hypothetical protein
MAYLAAMLTQVQIERRAQKPLPRCTPKTRNEYMRIRRAKERLGLPTWRERVTPLASATIANKARAARKTANC